MPVFVLTGPAIAGIVLGVVIILLLGGALAAFLFHKYCSKVPHPPERVSMEPEEVVKM